MSAIDSEVRDKPRRAARPAGKPRRQGIVRHLVLVLTSLVWISPLAYALYTALRPYADTAANGYVSVAHRLSFTNFQHAWMDADLPKYYLNTLIAATGDHHPALPPVPGDPASRGAERDRDDV